MGSAIKAFMPPIELMNAAIRISMSLIQLNQRSWHASTIDDRYHYGLTPLHSVRQ